MFMSAVLSCILWLWTGSSSSRRHRRSSIRVRVRERMISVIIIVQTRLSFRLSPACSIRFLCFIFVEEERAQTHDPFRLE